MGLTIDCDETSMSRHSLETYQINAKGQFLDINMTCFFSKSESAVVDEMIRTETLFAHFLVEHSVQSMLVFRNSKVAKRYIVRNCLPFPNVKDQ